MKKENLLKRSDVTHNLFSIICLLLSIGIITLVISSLVIKYQQNKKSNQVIQEIKEELNMPEYLVDESFFECYEPEKPIPSNMVVVLEIPE